MFASSSSDADLYQVTRPSWKKLVGVYVVIIVLFFAFLFGARRASRIKQIPASTQTLTLSNGTTMFAPTTILISLDGFRADFLQRDITPNLNALVQSGVSPQYMLPSFPSVTFPNHFTLVTGLYPESHGVVGNTFWDPEMQAEFYYTDPARSMQPKWWNAEPVWETLEYAGVRTAIHMWPGSEAHIGRVEPAYVDAYNGKELLSRKVDRVLGFLDLPGPDDTSAEAPTPRPQLIALYVPDVDADGHLHGPNSTEIRQTIEHADAMVGDIVRGLEERNLTELVNIVIVSDHGMASTDMDRLIELDTIVDMNKIEHTDGWPLYGLRPKDNAHLDELYRTLKAEAETSSKFEVYLKDVDMPERYHFSNNDRIAPLWIVPQTGWAIVRKHEFDEAKAAGVYHPRGLHGYDHEHPLMRAIFIARGPAFPHAPGSKVDPFQNIEVYNIVCDSVGVEPKPNNGTLRLPFKPSGQHDTVSSLDIPADPAELPTADRVSVTDTISTASTTVSDQPAATDVYQPEPSRPVVHDGDDQVDEDEDVNMWWEWISGQLDGIKNWASVTLGKVKGGDAAAAEDS